MVLLLLSVVAAIAGAKSGGGRREWFGLALMGLIWCDFRFHTPRQNPTIPARLLAPHLAGSGLPAMGQGRVFITGTAEEQLLRSRVVDAETDFAGKRLAQWSNLNLLDGIAKVDGAMTLRLAEPDRFQRRLLGNHEAASEVLLDLAGVTFRTSPANVTEWERRASALPLVTAGQAAVLVADDDTVAALTAPGFDPHLHVLLPTDATNARAPVRPVSAGVSELAWRPQRVTFVVESPQSTLAVIAQSFHSNWRATVNDRPTEVLRANAAFQAVVVPAGRSRVELRYVDRWWRVGGWVSFAALVVCGWLWRRSGQHADGRG